MKPINTLKFLFCTIAIVMGFPCLAGGTYYSQVTTTVASGEGKVYVSTSSETPEDSAYSSESTASNYSTTTGDSDTHTYYLFAKPADGYAFTGWSDNNSTANPRTISVTASGSKNSPTTATYSANFEPSYVTVQSDDTTLGSASVSPTVNGEGDQVTLTATIIKPTGSSEFSTTTKASKSISFKGWYNEDGDLVSDQLSFSYTVSKVETLTAVFEREQVVKVDDSGNIYGYYRLETPFFASNIRHFLCLTGDFEVGISKERALDGALEFNQDANWGNVTKKDAYAKTEAVFGDPGCIFYLTGTAKTENLYSNESRVQVASDVMADAQGVSSYKICGERKFKVYTANTPGYYVLIYSIGYDFSLQITYSRHLWFTTDKPTNSSYMTAGDFDVQPVDVEHIDQNYFGAYPDESMYYDGGYWTTMYTAFPYECYEEDGVEAYVVSSTQEVGGVNYIIIKKLEDGIVPAATPVLLKCKTTHVATNRLIPLEPTDSRLASIQIDNNLLKGEYGLYSANDYSGRAKYDGDKMRVFGANASGQLGFFKLSANSDGSAKELTPNRAYLDLTQLTTSSSTGVAAASYRLAFDDLTGIDEVAVDAADSALDAEKEYYNLQGQRVASPVPGQIYIVRQGSTVTKVVY